MSKEPDRREGNEHSTGAGTTPPARIMRSGTAGTAGGLEPGKVDQRGSGGDEQVGDTGPIIDGISGTGRVDETPGEDEGR